MTKEQEGTISYALGMLDGMSGSVHEDAEHYRELAKFLVERLREVFPEEVTSVPTVEN